MLKTIMNIHYLKQMLKIKIKINVTSKYEQNNDTYINWHTKV